MTNGQERIAALESALSDLILDGKRVVNTLGDGGLGAVVTARKLITTIKRVQVVLENEATK